MNKRKLAVAVAGFGAVLICASGVYFGTGASALLATSSGLITYPEDSWAEPTATPGPAQSATPEPAQSVSVEPTPVPVIEPVSEGPTSFDEQMASIPSDWPEAEVENARIWLEQAKIIGECLAGKGFVYSYTPFWLLESGPTEPWHMSVPEAEQNAAWLALWGDTGAGPDYRWEDAGCHGYAVHVTGQDKAH
jgi:hypothetical protein